MNVTFERERTTTGPKRRDKHYSYDESVDKPGRLIEEEPTDIEEENPVEDNEPVEQVEENKEADSPAFEE